MGRLEIKIKSMTLLFKVWDLEICKSMAVQCQFYYTVEWFDLVCIDLESWSSSSYDIEIAVFKLPQSRGNMKRVCDYGCTQFDISSGNLFCQEVNVEV